MSFHDTAAGKRFFGCQLPALITALNGIAEAINAPRPVYKLEQEVSPDFLVDLYYGSSDPSDPPDPQQLRPHTAAIIAHQEKMRKLLTPEAWDCVEQYRLLLSDRGAVEREQAFSAGFQFATKLFAAGLSTPQTTEKSE